MAKNQDDRELWEQQDGETAQAYAHFCRYRDMRYPVQTKTVQNADKTTTTTSVVVMDGSMAYQNRSLRKLAAELNINFRTIARQSEAGAWVERCEAYDRYVDRMNREANEAAIRKMNKEHALLAQQMIRKATNRLLRIPDDQISMANLVRMVDVAVKVERLSRGESTENQSVQHTGEIDVKNDRGMDLSKLSNEELEQFEQVLQKIAGTSDG